MSKKLIIMIAAAGLTSFAGAFVFARLTKPSPNSQHAEPNQPALAHQQAELKLPQPAVGTVAIAGASDGTMKKTMTEKQLKNLVYEVQEKNKEYTDKLRSLQTRQQRLQMAQETLKKDIENLNNLRIELASIVASLKSERDKLAKSRVEIAQAEKANLVKIAAAYDKMDAASASKILTNMCKSQAQSAGPGRADSNLDDAIKILHYMSERTKANLLAELVTSEPQLAAFLCGKLKQIEEEK
ncbi:MAG: hypothetical protein ACETVZ_05465 [Phycisphaerae bacterium]